MLSQIICQDLNSNLAFYLPCITCKSLTSALLSQKEATLLSLKYSLLNSISECLWSPLNKVSKGV